MEQKGYTVQDIVELCKCTFYNWVHIQYMLLSQLGSAVTAVQTDHDRSYHDLCTVLRITGQCITVKLCDAHDIYKYLEDTASRMRGIKR